MQPWFWTLAVVVGQYYGVWWQSIGTPEPVYVAPRYIVAEQPERDARGWGSGGDAPGNQDAFNVTITAPGLHHRNPTLREN